MAGQRGFFDVDERYAALSAAGDPLERLAAVVESSCSGRSWRRRSRARTGPGAGGRPMMRC
jgi:transposase, IS5 family